MHLVKVVTTVQIYPSFSADVDASKSGDELPDILFLILHGGSPMDARDDRVGKAIDFQTISEHMREIIDLHFHSASGRVALRLVPCTNVCSHALNLLCAVNNGHCLCTYMCWGGCGLTTFTTCRRI